MAAAEALPVVHAAATFAMFGVGWFVQVAHYPLMDRVGREAFPGWEVAYADRMGLVAGPLMVVEALAQAALVLWPPAGAPAWLGWVGLGLVGALWASTGLVQVPCHAALARGFDEAIHRRLVRTNWARTALWTLRALVAARYLLPA